MKTQLYLASRSSRRAEILTQLGVRFTVLPADIDESRRMGESPADYVLRLACEKAQACMADVAQRALLALPILAADTTVSIDNDLLGKPVDIGDAASMLERISGTWHEVHTGVAVATAHTIDAKISTTRVQFKPLTPDEIAAYIATGEPFDKAGAYGIQGLAGLWIARIEGSYSGVMGLPIFETGILLAQAGIVVMR